MAENAKKQTREELKEELVETIEKIKSASSSFSIAKLSKEALDIVKKINEARKELELKPEPKDVEIELLGDIIFGDQSLHPLRYLRIKKNDMPGHAIVMARKFLEAITANPLNKEELRSHISDLSFFRYHLIQILEEKFGINIRFCEYCDYYDAKKNVCPICKVNAIFIHFRKFNNNEKCDKWVPKEIPEEKK